jgi:tetratricopeptide (TPR) repeat protein
LSAIRGYTDLNVDPIALGREQKVDYVLSSTYQIADGKIKITTHLVNVATGQIEGTYPILTDVSTVFEIQEAVAADVSRMLKSRFGVKDARPIAKRGTSSEEAYRLYQQGMNLIEQRGPEQARKAIRYFEQAIELDPNYARAYAGKTRAHKALGTLGGLDRDEFQKGWEAAERALELDSSLADGYAARGELQYKFQRDWTAAESDFLRALELEPNNADAIYLYGEFLGHDKRFEESTGAIDRALEIYPNNLMFQRDRGRMLYFERRYDDAIAQLQQVIEIDPSYRTAYSWLFWAYLMKGDQESAYRTFLRWQEVLGADTQEFESAYQSSGIPGLLRTALARLEGLGPSRIHSLLNEKDQAFAKLEVQLERGRSQISMLYADPAFDNLRSDPRYDDLVSRIRKK